MADIRKIGGKMKLVQERTTGRTDTDSGYKFVVSSTVSSVENYVETIQVLNPQAAFVMTNSQYGRIATISDIINIPAFHPDVPGGEYRGVTVVRSFVDVEQAVAWSRKVYDSLNALHNQLKDYIAVFENTTETVVIPDTANTELYNRIQSYLGAKTSYENTLQQLSVAKAKKEVLDEVYSSAYVEDGGSQWQATGGAVDVLRSTLPEVRSVLDTASKQLKRTMGVDPGSIQTIPNSITGLQEAGVSFDAARANLSAATNDAGVIVEAVSGGEGGFPDYDDLTEVQQVALGTVGAGAARIVTSISSALDDIAAGELNVDEAKAVLSNFRRDAQASSTSIEFLSSIMDSSGVAVNDSSNAIERINIQKGINYKKLGTLRNKLIGDIKALEIRLEEFTVTKQEYLKSIQALYPEVDPGDPMKVFTHRIFRTL